MLLFSVTYEIVTDASAEYGEAEETGFVCRDVTLRSIHFPPSLSGASRMRIARLLGVRR